MKQYKDIITLIRDGKLEKARVLFCEALDARADDALYEAGKKIVIKVTSKGKRTRKIKCGKGYHLVNGSCVPMTGSEKAKKKRAIKKAVRTKKAAGAGAKRRSVKARLKAMKKRKGMGL